MHASNSDYPSFVQKFQLKSSWQNNIQSNILPVKQNAGWSSAFSASFYTDAALNKAGASTQFFQVTSKFSIKEDFPF